MDRALAKLSSPRKAAMRRGSATGYELHFRPTAVAVDPSKLQRRKAEEAEYDGEHTFFNLPKAFLARVFKKCDEKDIVNVCLSSPEALLKTFAAPVHVQINPRQLLGNLKWLNKRRAPQIRQRDRFQVFLSVHCYPKELDHIVLFTWNIYHLVVTERDIVSDVMLRAIQSLVNLQTLDLRLCTGISGEGLEYVRGARNLKSLDLGWCMSLNDTSICTLSKLPILESIDLSYCAGINDQACKYLSACPYLQRLDIRGCTNITGAGLKLLSQCPQLKSLNLKDCFQFSDADLVPLNDLILRNRCTVYGTDGAVLYGVMMERKGATKLTQLMHRKEQPPFVYYVHDLRTVLQKHGLQEYSGVVETLRERPGGNAPPMARPKGQSTANPTSMGAMSTILRAKSNLLARRDNSEVRKIRKSTVEQRNQRASDIYDLDMFKLQRMAEALGSGVLGVSTSPPKEHPTASASRTPVMSRQPTMPGSRQATHEGQASSPSKADDRILRHLLTAASSAFSSSLREGDRSRTATRLSKESGNTDQPTPRTTLDSFGGAEDVGLDRAKSTASRVVVGATEGTTFILPTSIPPGPSTPTSQWLTLTEEQGTEPEDADYKGASEPRLRGNWKGGVLQLLRSEADGPRSIVAHQMTRPQSAWELHPGDPLNHFPVHLLLDNEAEGGGGPSGGSASGYGFGGTLASRPATATFPGPNQFQRPSVLLTAQQLAERGRPRTAQLNRTIPTPAQLNGEANRWLARPQTATAQELKNRYQRKFQEPGVPSEARRTSRSVPSPSLTLHRTHPKFTTHAEPNPLMAEIAERMDALGLGASSKRPSTAAPVLQRQQAPMRESAGAPSARASGGVGSRPPSRAPARLSASLGRPQTAAPTATRSPSGKGTMLGVPVNSTFPLAGRNINRVREFAEVSSSTSPAKARRSSRLNFSATAAGPGA